MKFLLCGFQFYSPFKKTLFNLKAANVKFTVIRLVVTYELLHKHIHSVLANFLKFLDCKVPNFDRVAR